LGYHETHVMVAAKLLIFHC